MKALTLTQPWAGLVALGIKRLENRTRMFPRGMDGERFAVHASRQIDGDALRQVRLDPEVAATTSVMRSRLIVTSAVIGVATLERNVCTGFYDDDRDKFVDALETSGPIIEVGDQRRWYTGPVAYLLRDAAAVATPIPCRGMLGFWTLPEEVERALLGQLQEAA